MRELLKKLWIGSGNALSAIMSFFAVLFFSSHTVARKLRKKGKELNTSKKAFVLGNGPSLKEVLETPKLRKELEEGDIIVTNRFATSDEFYKLKPAFYILMDPLFFDEQEIEKDITSKEMYEAFNKVDWQMTLFLPKEASLVVVNKYLHNPSVDVLLFNGTTIIGPSRFINRMFRKGLGLPNSRNIILPALMLMINFGYKNVYLYGAEFSWTKNFDVDPKDNKLFLNDRHFYKTNNVITVDPAYKFDKGYYRWSLESIAEMLKGTETIALYASSVGVHVFNRTKGSFIDAFDYENPDMI